VCVYALFLPRKISLPASCFRWQNVDEATSTVIEREYIGWHIACKESCHCWGDAHQQAPLAFALSLWQQIHGSDRLQQSIQRLLFIYSTYFSSQSSHQVNDMLAAESMEEIYKTQWNNSKILNWYGKTDSWLRRCLRKEEQRRKGSNLRSTIPPN
jgi:hypothetical protein